MTRDDLLLDTTVWKPIGLGITDLEICSKLAPCSFDFYSVIIFKSTNELFALVIKCQFEISLPQLRPYNFKPTIVVKSCWEGCGHQLTSHLIRFF